MELTRIGTVREVLETLRGMWNWDTDVTLMIYEDKKTYQFWFEGSEFHTALPADILISHVVGFSVNSVNSGKGMFITMVI